jgi:K+-sensing histidine kinase KdpD
MTGRLREYAEVAAVISLVTLLGWYVPLNYRAFGDIYLLAVIGISLRVSPGPALLAAVVSGLAWNYVYMPPRLSFSVLKIEDELQLATYFVVALIGSQMASLRTASARAKLLAASDRLHRTLLDSVSHELRTPIAVLRSAGEQLTTEDRLKRQRLVAEIGTAVRRLDHLVANLLNQTRLEAGVVRARPDWCDPHDLVAAAIRAAGEPLRTRPPEVRIPDSVPLFYADAALMEQVLANLLINAAVHTPDQGAIRVAAGADQGGRRVWIDVRDEGPGIPLETQRRIFDKFQRGAAAGPGGLGLGLAIVRGFMLAQGGDVSLWSEPGRGSRFVVYLPHVPCEAVPHT